MAKTAKFDIDEQGDLPIWVQLRDRFVYLISSGFYEPEEQLPSVRKLAAELRINYNTVSKAYVALEHEGYITSRRGSGAYVRAVESETGLSELDLMAEEFVKGCLAKGVGYDEIPKCLTRAIRRMKGEGNGEESQDE